MSLQESLRIVPKGEIAFVEFDLIGEKVNKLSSPVMARFKDVIEELGRSNYKAVVLISRKPKNFIAGADIDEIKKLNTREAFLDVLKPAHEILNAFEDLPIPTIAAINGACVGGGCELVMAADYRLCADNKETKIGLPETKLGIIPGFGGCVRMPRIVGLQASLDIILAGKTIEGKKAAKIGLVDECVPTQMLEAKALEYAQDILAGKKGKRRKHFEPKGAVNKFLESFAGRPVVFSQARKSVLSMTKGHYPAPLKAIDVIRKTYGMSNRDKALKIEMQGFADVGATDVSKNLIDLFFMMEAVKKQTGVSSDAKPREVKALGVLGAGTMGGGIAQVAADKGIHVRLKDISTDGIGIGLKQAHDIWAKEMKRRKITSHDFQAKMALITGGLDYAGFKTLDVVIEAIVEDMNVKKKVLAETAGQCDPNVILATNTSSLSVTEMATACPRPENFVGMHFFNPVNKMPLVEVIRGPKTSDEAVTTIFELSKKMGKTPVVVKDGPGFLVNRLLMPYMTEAMFMLEEGMSIETVDRYYTHTFGMPMGPYRLMDEVGLDVCVKVVKIFKKSLGDRIEVPKLVETLAASKRLGRKNNFGFYKYDEAGKEAGVDSSVYTELGLKYPSNPLTEKEVIERGIFVMVNEAALALVEEKIVERPQDVDLAMIMGTGFPPFRGGLLKYADSLGSRYVVQELEMYASRLGIRFRPCTPISNMAKTDRKFYGEGSAKRLSNEAEATI